MNFLDNCDFKLEEMSNFQIAIATTLEIAFAFAENTN